MSHKTKLSGFDFSEDIFLVSYPKSGNTWLRLLIGNYLTRNQCDFTNLNRICPDYQFCLDFNILHELENATTPRIFKSHSTYKPEFKRVAYIVRDGRDAIVSYYFYSILIYDEAERRGVPPTMSFEEFAREILTGNEYLPSWKEHVSSWLDNPVDKLLLIRYEDLHADASRELTRFLDFFEIPIDESQVKEAVSRCKFENLRKMEDEQRNQRKLLQEAGKVSNEIVFSESDILRVPTNKNIPPRLQFMRKGEIGDWKHIFSPSILAEFLDSQGDMLVRLQYRLQYIDLELVQAFKARKREVEAARSELTQLKSALEDSQNKVKDATYELQQYRAESQKTIAHQEKLISLLNSSIQEMEDIVQQKSSKINHLRKQLKYSRDSLRDEKGRLKELREEVIYLRKEVKYLNGTRGSLKSLIRNIRFQFRQLFKFD